MANGDTSLTRVLEALAQNDPDVSEVVTAMAEKASKEVIEVASALVYGGKAGTARPADFAQVAPVAAYRGKVDRPGLGTDGTQLLMQLAGDETLLEKLSQASKDALDKSNADFLQSRLSPSGVLQLRLSDTEILQVGLSDTEILQVQQNGPDTLRVGLSDTEILQVKLSDTEILQLRLVDCEGAPKGQRRNVVAVSLSDTEILQVKLSDTEILQLSLSDTEILQLRLSDTEILQVKLSDTEILQVRLSDTEILQAQLTDTEILQSRLSDTEILQSKLSETGVASNEPLQGGSPASLSDTEILQLRRSERSVAAALAVLEESGFPPIVQDIADLDLKIAQIFSMFVGHERDDDLLALLLATARFLPALKLVGECDEAAALGRLAENRTKTLLALARLASERFDLLKALVDLVSGGLAALAQAGQPEVGSNDGAVQSAH